MANEIQIRVSLQVKKGVVDFQSRPTAFSADIEADVLLGPTPGAINIPIGGAAVDLSSLGTPGWCWIQNQDEEVSVEIGVHNGTDFYPLLELGPGECVPLPLSRHLNARETVTGTGTVGTEINDLWIKPLTNVPTGQVTVLAFER